MEDLSRSVVSIISAGTVGQRSTGLTAALLARNAQAEGEGASPLTTEVHPEQYHSVENNKIKIKNKKINIKIIKNNKK